MADESVCQSAADGFYHWGHILLGFAALVLTAVALCKGRDAWLRYKETKSVYFPPPAPDTPGVGAAGDAMATLNMEHPQKFYLPDSAMEELADAVAFVDGARLLLHSQVLSAQSAVLRSYFCLAAQDGCIAPQQLRGVEVGKDLVPPLVAAGTSGYLSGDSQGPGLVDLSASFASSSLTEATWLLRFVYSRDKLAPAAFHVLAACPKKGLLGVARLAHKLNAPLVLDAISAFLSGTVETAQPWELAAWLQLADHCQLAHLRRLSIAAMVASFRLAAGGAFWKTNSCQASLAACGSEVLADVLVKLVDGLRATGIPSLPTLLDVREQRRGHPACFTFALKDVAGYWCGMAAVSPWAAVGGHQWRLCVYPRWDTNSDGTNMKAQLEYNAAAVGGAEVTVEWWMCARKLEGAVWNKKYCRARNSTDDGFTLTTFEPAKPSTGFHRIISVADLRAAQPNHKDVIFLSVQLWLPPRLQA